MATGEEEGGQSLSSNQADELRNSTDPPADHKRSLSSAMDQSATDELINNPTDERTLPLIRALQEALAEIDSQEKADAILEELAQTLGEEPVEEAADLDADKPAAEAAAEVAEVEAQEQAGEASPADVLEESAHAVAETEGADREAVSDAIQEVFQPEQQDKPTVDQETKRSYLRRALLKRLGPLDALDTELFLLINRLPHPRLLNRFFYFLTVIYRGGAAWYAFMLALLLWRPPLGRRLWRNVAVPLGLAIWLVEYPIKSYFRRRRPFISIVQVMVIGRKPGSWSFPSGHSATAYGGAWLLSRYLPAWRFPLYLVATLTAFSRIYLGAHYPGDVVAGSTLGILFASILHRLPWPWRSSQSRRR